MFAEKVISFAGESGLGALPSDAVISAVAIARKRIEASFGCRVSLNRSRQTFELRPAVRSTPQSSFGFGIHRPIPDLAPIGRAVFQAAVSGWVDRWPHAVFSCGSPLRRKRFWSDDADA